MAEKKILTKFRDDLPKVINRTARHQQESDASDYEDNWTEKEKRTFMDQLYTFGKSWSLYDIPEKSKS